MATEFENKIRSMIQGYEQLEALTSQMPADILTMASKYSNQLLGESTLLTKQDHEEIKAQSRQVEDIRSDLEGMAYERVILDVLTRDVISSAKRKGKNLYQNQNQANAPKFSTRARPSPAFASHPSRLRSTQPTLSSTLGPPPVTATGATPSLDDFIPIPSYRTSHPTAPPRADPSGASDAPSQPLSTRRNIPSSQHASLTIGSKSSKMMQGSLPPEIAFLANSPPLSDDKRRSLKTGNTKPKRTTMKESTKKNNERILKMKQEINDFEKRSQRQLNSQGQQISSLLSSLQNHDQGLQKSVGEMISHLRHEQPSVSAPRRRIVIEEEIMNELEEPRILYPSNSRPSHASAASLATATATAAITTASLSSKQQSSHSQPQPSQQQQREEGKVDVEEEVEESYGYNLVIDDYGTRWMPIPEKIIPTSSVPVPLEKYSLPQDSGDGSGRGQRKGAKGGGGGYLGETRESILGILEDQDESSPMVIVENKGTSSLPFPVSSSKASQRTNGEAERPSDGDAAASTVSARESNRGPVAMAWEEDRYREVPLRRGEVRKGTGSNQSQREGESWGEDRYVAPYVSRVKIHSKPVSVPLKEEPLPEVLEVSPKETASAETSVSSSGHGSGVGAGGGEKSEDLIELLKLLVSTQQQTLQGHNELMLRILQREDNGKKEDDEAMLGFRYPLQASARGGRSLTASAAAPRDVAPRIAQREEEEEEEESMEPKKLIEEDNRSDDYTEATETEDSREQQDLIGDIPQTFHRTTYQTSFGCLLSEGWNYGLARQQAGTGRGAGEDEAQESREKEEQQQQEEQEQEQEEVPKLLWEAAGGETGGHQGRKRGEELRLHRLPELHTIQTLNQLQHEDNENYDSPRSPRQQHIQQQQQQGDPVATVATVMITALRAMVEGQTTSAAAAAPPPPPRSSIKARVISHHPSRAPPLPVATAPVGRYEQPTYPLQNPARYYTNGGQDTIGGSFNASGIYGPRNFSQQQGKQRLVTSRGASQQLQQGQGSGPWVETRERWQSEYGVDHEVYPYFESKIPRHSSYSSRSNSNSHSHTAPRRQRSGGGRGVSTGSGVGVYVPESEDENDERVTDLVTERSILEDMKQSQFHQKSLQQRHGLGHDWSSSQEEDWDDTEERRWEQGQHQQRERQSRGQGQSHLSSDGSLEEYSFLHHKPHGLRQGHQQSNGQRQGGHGGGGRGQEPQEESDVDLYDPQQLGSSLFPLPRPLVSYQMNNAATKETIDWDMDSLLAEDQQQRQRQRGQQRGKQGPGIRRGRSKSKGGAIEREDESVEELLSMKPLRSVTTSRSGEKKRLRHQPEPLHLVPDNHRTHSRDRLRERGVWDQQQQEEEEYWYSPTKDLSSSVSSSDQSLTSASLSASGTGYGAGAVFGSRRGGGYGDLLLVPTLSDYEPSTPTLSIATDSTSSDKFQRRREHLRHIQKPQNAMEDTKSPVSSGPLSSLPSQRSVEGDSSSFSSSSPPPSAYSTSSSSSCSSEAEAAGSTHSNGSDEGSSTLGEDKSEFADSSDSDSDFDHLLNLQSEHRDKNKGGDKKDGLLAAKSIIATAAGAKRNEPPVLDRSKVRLWKPDSGVLRKKS